MAESSRLLKRKRIDGFAVEAALERLTARVEHRGQGRNGDGFELQFVTGFRGKTWRGQRVWVSILPKSDALVQVVVRSQSRWWQPVDWGEPQEVAELVMDHLVTAMPEEPT